nr:ATP-dependent Clp protease proteolytic subunit 1 [Polygala tenuifolia]
MPVGVPKVPFSFDKDEDQDKVEDKDRDQDVFENKEKDRDLFEYKDRLEDKDKDEDKVEDKDKRKSKAKPYVDLYTRMYHERFLFLFGELNTRLAGTLMGILTHFSVAEPEKDFLLFINSPGGGLGSGVSLYTAMQYVTPDVSTVCVGSAFSMASFILAGGAKEKRAATPHSRIMLHEPRTDYLRTRGSDIFKDMRELKKLTLTVIQQLAKITEKSQQTVYRDMKLQMFMSPTKAKIYGIIDDIVEEEYEDYFFE